MKKIDKLRRSINDGMSEELAKACKEAFPDLELETEFSILSGHMVTRPANQKKFTKEQHSFIRGFSNGYGMAMEQVREAR